MKSCELNLPVFKQGDDLHHCLTRCVGDVRAAFELQAEHYEEAARMCRRMMGVAAELPDLEVEAGTHYIGVQGPAERLEALVQEGLLSTVEYDDEDEDDDDVLDEDEDVEVSE